MNLKGIRVGEFDVRPGFVSAPVYRGFKEVERITIPAKLYRDTKHSERRQRNLIDRFLRAALQRLDERE